jgi:hypothetical protein
MSLIIKKTLVTAAVAVAGLGMTAGAFAQTATNDATKGTVNSDVTASTTTGASSTMAGHHTRKSSKHKSASSSSAASQ